MLKVFILLALALVSSLFVNAQSTKLIVADFNQGERITNLGEEFGAWNKDSTDSTQSCQISFAQDDALGDAKGKSLQLIYDVDSPNPAYNGFWLKISNAKIIDFDTLSFYVKGDANKGFTKKIKIELKDKNKGKATFVIENITNEWQKISLTLDKRSMDEKQALKCQAMPIFIINFF